MAQAPPPLPPGTYLGAPLRAVEAPGRLLVRESGYASGLRLPRHSHACVHLCLVMAGEYEEELEGRPARRSVGDLMLYPRGAIHAETHAGAGRHLIIELGTPLVTRASEQGVDLDGARALSSSGERRFLLLRLRRELLRADDLSPLSAEGCLLELLAELARDQGAAVSRARPPWLALVEDVLRGQLGAPPSLDELGRAVGVHPARVAREFRRAHGCSIGTFVRRLRVARAQDLLRRTAAPIAAVAVESGFYDQSHLGRVFRIETGMTPRQCRALNDSPVRKGE